MDTLNVIFKRRSIRNYLDKAVVCNAVDTGLQCCIPEHVTPLSIV